MGSSDGVAATQSWWLSVELKVLHRQSQDKEIAKRRESLVKRIECEYQRETLPIPGNCRRVLPTHRAFVFLSWAGSWRNELQTFDQTHGLAGAGDQSAPSVEIDFDSSVNVANMVLDGRTEPSREELLRKLRERQI